MYQKLNKSYYLQDDVVSLARSLLGKVLVTNIDGILTSGIITETEAYAGINDKASHAYNNRRTKRTEVMYMEGGVAYVYFCYGMHYLFNIVSNLKNIPDAILIRSIEPLEGIEHMLTRKNKQKFSKHLTIGPGNVTKALGINTTHSGVSLLGNHIWLEDRNINLNDFEMTITPRIGIAYAQEDAKLPYRFVINRKK